MTGQGQAVGPSPGDVLISRILGFVQALRAAAVPVSTVEVLDAMAALRHLSMADPEPFRAALGATLVKRATDFEVFQHLFATHFRRRRAAGSSGSALPSPSAKDPDPPADGKELLEELLEALKTGDLEALNVLAALAVAQFAGLDSPSEGSSLPSERHALYRVLRQLELSNLWQRASRERAAPGAHPMTERLAREEVGRRVEELRRLIAEEIRRRLADLHAIRRSGEPPRGPIEDVPFAGASFDQLQEMRRAVRPLARALAARIAQRRRSRQRGRLDMRRTLRRGLSAGGVPLFPAFRRRRVSRPELFLLCDVSGSVAEFAAFTMALLTAMAQEFSRLRSFAFVDGVDEVTAAFASDRPPQVARQLLARADLVSADGHSDYGRVFARFGDVYGSALTPRTTLIITGDARNNYRDPGLGPLCVLRERVRRLYWLNPEPHASWNGGDSLMSSYGTHCDGVYEVGSLRQLADFVLQIA
jgi:uncharacterized protein